jgi:hypothetical protein
MAANATNTLQATIISADANGAISINRGLGNPALAGNVGQLTVNEQLSLGANVITMALGSSIFNLYVKNNAAAGGGTVSVALNLNGAGLQTVALLQPGGVCIIWNTVNNVGGSGYTGMTLTASVGTLPVEYFLGA